MIFYYIWTFSIYVTDMSLSLKRPWRLPGLTTEALEAMD